MMAAVEFSERKKLELIDIKNNMQDSLFGFLLSTDDSTAISSGKCLLSNQILSPCGAFQCIDWFWTCIFCLLDCFFSTFRIFRLFEFFDFFDFSSRNLLGGELFDFSTFRGQKTWFSRCDRYQPEEHTVQWGPPIYGWFRMESPMNIWKFEHGFFGGTPIQEPPMSKYENVIVLDGFVEGFV